MMTGGHAELPGFCSNFTIFQYLCLQAPSSSDVLFLLLNQPNVYVITYLYLFNFTDAVSDVESISSDMSDEFMVVPIPPCFDPDSPLTAGPSPVTVSITEDRKSVV